MDLAEFVKRFEKIKAMGWIRSMRRGNTGIGYTLEELLGIPENNIAGPDLGKIELKAHRINSSSMSTLFTFNRKAWKMNPLDAIKQYGTPDDNGRLGMYFTMSQRPNSSRLFLDINDETISVRHTSGEVVLEWKLKDVVDEFDKYLPSIILVRALREENLGKESFLFMRSQICEKHSPEIIFEQFWIEHLFLDLHINETDENITLKCIERELPTLFSSVLDL